MCVVGGNGGVDKGHVLLAKREKSWKRFVGRGIGMCWEETREGQGGLGWGIANKRDRDRPCIALHACMLAFEVMLCSSMDCLCCLYH